MFQLSVVHTHTKKKTNKKKLLSFPNLVLEFVLSREGRGQCRPQAPGVHLGFPEKKVMDRIGVQQQAGTFTELCMVFKRELIVWFREGPNL